MTTTTATPNVTATKRTNRKPHPLRRSTLFVGAATAAGITAFAAVVHAADVPLAIDGKMIPLMGFTQLTFVGAVLGGLLAALFNRRGWSRSRYVATTIVLTVASCIPSVTLPPDTATKLSLVIAHLLAAGAIVPVLARRVQS